MSMIITALRPKISQTALLPSSAYTTTPRLDDKREKERQNSQKNYAQLPSYTSSFFCPPCLATFARHVSSRARPHEQRAHRVKLGYGDVVAVTHAVLCVIGGLTHCDRYIRAVYWGLINIWFFFFILLTREIEVVEREGPSRKKNMKIYINAQVLENSVSSVASNGFIGVHKSRDRRSLGS